MPTMTFTSGNDSFTVTGSGTFDLNFLAGDDSLLINGGTFTTAFMGLGNDRVTLRVGDASVFGEAGSDRFEIFASDTEVNGGDGADLFNIRAGSAFALNGGLGNDRYNFAVNTILSAFGSDGNDLFAGYNHVIGGEIAGGAGNDLFYDLRGAVGGLTVYGGTGNDVFRADPTGLATFVEHAGEGIDTVQVARGANYTLPANFDRIAVLNLPGSTGAAATLTGNNLTNEIRALGNNDNLNGLGGNDRLFGAAGNDNLFGGTENDFLDGGDGDDALSGQAGNDLLDGGAGNDTMFGGLGNDTYFLDSLSDLVAEGVGEGTDTVRVSITGYTLTNNVEKGIIVGSVGFALTGNALGNALTGGGGDDGIVGMDGNDTIDGGNGNDGLDGGGGNDTLRGGSGNDVLIAGDGNDVLTGGIGTDTMFGGAGNDVFTWNPGDSSDVLEGQAGTDRLDFHGSNASETIAISPNGARAGFFRDVAAITMDMDDVEQIHYDAFGGADTVTINDMTGTDVALVKVALAAVAGGGDSQTDRVTVNATLGADAIGIASLLGEIHVTGLAAETVVTGSEATDALVIDGGAGDDVIDGSGLAAGLVSLQLVGGTGNDVFIGSAGGDFISGGSGNDVALMGAGDDVFAWNPGSGNDTIEGQSGTADTLLFNGSNINENITISPNGGRVLFSRDVAAVTMDLNDVEAIDFHALGGTDNITVNDMTGTDLTSVVINLANAVGGGDGQADIVTINGTNGDDSVFITQSGGTIVVTGLPAVVQIIGFEPGVDTLVINALGGNDLVNGSALDASVGFTAHGGIGNDTLTGGGAVDSLFGEDGNDFLSGNGSIDILDGGTGSDIIIQ